MISDELKTQVQRFQRTRSFALNENLKEELADWFRLTRKTTLNVRCGTCLRNAMNDLAKSIQEESNKEIKPAKIQFIGVKQYNYDGMSYNELKREAKKKGIKMEQAPTKQELLEALKR
jgi:hypothetical protein